MGSRDAQARTAPRRAKLLEATETHELVEQARQKEWTSPSFIAEMFMGKADFTSVSPFPFQSEQDKKIGDEYLARLDAFLRDNIDSDQIDRDYKIPRHIVDGLARLGAFGMKIPRKYGGLGLSHMNYNRALGLVGSYDASIATLLSAHQSIGVPQPLILFGTEEQKQRYLPRFARGEISAFALTEPEVGSDPARMSTTATPTEDGNHYLINGTKLWCTNGVIADVLVVMARTPVFEDGREKSKITAFIVEKNMPGFEVAHRCSFMGLHGIENAVLRFNNVRVPKENILWGLGKGLRLAFITLNAGRLSLPGAVIGGANRALDIAIEWSNQRKQWGKAIGEHEAIAAKVASIAARAYAMEAMTWLVTSWVDNHTHDVRLESAMAKLFCSEASVEIIDELVQIRGGRGYESEHSLRARGEKGYGVERMYRDARINKIVEGTSEILRFFIAREGMDRHLKLGTPVLDPGVAMPERLKAALRAGAFYAGWLPGLFLSYNLWPRYSSYGEFAPSMRFVARMTKKLARTTFGLMLRNGPKLERRQLQLMRLVDVATDLFAMTAVVSRARSEGSKRSKILATLFCRETMARVRTNFNQIRDNQDVLRARVARELLQQQAVPALKPTIPMSAPVDTRKAG